MRGTRIMVGVGLASLALTACGSSSADTTAPKSGGSSTQAAPSTKPATLTCASVTAAEISAAVGATVTLSDGPTGDCEYEQEDVRAPSGNFGLLPDADVNGGYPVYVSAMASMLTNPTKHEVPGIGNAAVIYIGPNPGGTNKQATAAADLGSNHVLVVAVQQGNDLSEATMVDIATKLLTVLATKVG